MEKIQKLKLIIEDLVLNYKEDAKLSIIEFSSKLLAHITTLVILIIISSLSIIFFTISLALYLNEVLSSGYLGYLVISIIYLLLFTIIKTVVNNRKQPLLVKTYISVFIKLLFNEKEN